MGWLKIRRIIENSAKSGTRAASALFQGDVGRSASYGANPAAGTKETRERYTRRGGGAASGAVGGFITGGPIGAVVGGVIGAIRARKGQGQTKHYATSFVIGAAAGYAVSYVGANYSTWTAASYAKGAGTLYQGYQAYSAYARQKGADQLREGEAGAYDYGYYDDPYSENVDASKTSEGGGDWMRAAEKTKSRSGMEGALLLVGALFLVEAYG